MRVRRTLVALLALVLPLVGDSDARPESTRKMAEMLDRIYRDQDWKTDPNKAAERAAYYRQILMRPLDLRTELRARLDLAQNLLIAGDSAEAVEQLENLRVWSKEKGILLTPKFEQELREWFAIAYLRMGEQQNCLQNHSAQACIYPIEGKGIHADKRGAEGSVREYTELLRQYPNDLASRWLLNIAYMTLGKHPGSVPKQWLIPSSILPVEGASPRFKDVAASAKVDLTTRAGGSIAEDFDGDGLFDLVVSSSGPRDQLRYLHNNGDGTFSDQTHEAGLDGETGGLNLIHADFNNDGYPDILVLRGGWWGKHGKYPASLLRNNGPNTKGQITFTDVTEQAGLLSLHPTQTAAWADYDGDGWLDLFLGHESNVEESHPSALYHNNRDGTFTDIGPAVGLADMGYVKGVAWGDYNNDGRPDLYISRKGAPNLLFRNDGADKTRGWKFTDVTEAAGVREPIHSFATWFFDYDNDSWLDLLVTGYYTEEVADIAAFHLGLPAKVETPRMYHNNHDGTFKDVTKEVGLDRVILAMGAGFGDLDSDGWLDCYFGTGAPEYQTLLPNRMFRNQDGRRFVDITAAGGFGQLQKGHAVSFADFNRDGAQDIYQVLGGAYPGDSYKSVLLGNPGHGNHWLGLKLEGVASNRSAIGARVLVEVATSGGLRTIHRVVNSGTSFGDSPLELHIGLGAAKSIRRVEVSWPSGKTATLKGLAMDAAFKVKENSSDATRIRYSKFAFINDDGQVHRH